MITLSDILNAAKWYYDIVSPNGDFEKDYLSQFTEQEIKTATEYVAEQYSECDYSGEWYGCFVNFLDGVKYSRTKNKPHFAK